jgi:hypothetical protein
MELFDKIPDFRGNLICRFGSGKVKLTSADYFEETSKATHDELEGEGCEKLPCSRRDPA